MRKVQLLLICSLFCYVGCFFQPVNIADVFPNKENKEMCNCEHGPLQVATVKVMVLWHQSNSVGRCAGTPKPIDPTVHQLSRDLPIASTGYDGVSDMNVIQAYDPLQNWGTGVDPNEIGFARDLVSLIKSNPFEQWIIIPAARGNSGFAPINTGLNSWRVGDDLYNDLVARCLFLKNQYANIPNTDLQFELMVGIGGENDTESGGYFNPNFQTDLDGFYAAVRSAIGEPDIKILAGTMLNTYTTAQGANAVTNNNIILDLENRVTDAKGVDLTDPILTGCDGVHFSADAFQVGGVAAGESVPERFAAAYATL